LLQEKSREIEERIRQLQALQQELQELVAQAVQLPDDDVEMKRYHYPARNCGQHADLELARWVEVGEICQPTLITMTATRMKIRPPLTRKVRIWCGYGKNWRGLVIKSRYG
jgi:hypothetical protein